MTPGSRVVATTLLLALFWSLPTPARAQTPVQSAESKRQKILELIQLTSEQLSMKELIESVLIETDKAFDENYASIIESSPDLTPEEKERLIAKRLTYSARISQKFRKRFIEELDFEGVVRGISLSLYDKYFTEQEIVDLIQFYETPTGKKALTIMPQLSAESIRLSQERIGPQVMQIAQEVIEETLEEIQREEEKAEGPGPA